jgi:hypothetical protein
MKNLGIILLIIGIGLAVYALSMDTSVQVDYPMGNDYGLPERVNNIGLMNDKQNYLIFGGLLTVVGIFMAVSGGKSEKANAITTTDDNKKCPQCAEMVKAEARICRFCNYQFADEIPMQ